MNAPPPPPAAELLSPREGEVAVLVAEGISNRDIAGTLGVTEDTVKKHVSSALAKLGLRRRAQLVAAIAAVDRQR